MASFKVEDLSNFLTHYMLPLVYGRVSHTTYPGFANPDSWDRQRSQDIWVNIKQSQLFIVQSDRAQLALFLVWEAIQKVLISLRKCEGSADPTPIPSAKGSADPWLLRLNHLGYSSSKRMYIMEISFPSTWTIADDLQCILWEFISIISNPTAIPIANPVHHSHNQR